MSPSPHLLAFSIASASLLAIWGVIKWWKAHLSRLPYPPGPPMKNLLSGNLVDTSIEAPWLKYAELRESYGNILHFRVYGQHVVVLNSFEDAVELLERRSNNYSDRPHTTMVDLMGWDFNSGLKRYGNEWRQHRRLLQELFKREASLEYQPIQARKINDMLYGLLTTPEDFFAHTKTVAGAIMMSTMYDFDIAPKGDYFVDLAEAAVFKLSEAFFLSAAAVNALPILRFLPAWFPGAGFKRFAQGAKQLTDQMLAVPIENVEKRLADGAVLSCAVARLLEDCESRGGYESIKQVAATAYAAGADTTVSSIETFFLAMTMFPMAQKEAQEEIDTVIGNIRMPTYDDRPSLPRTEALYREVLRWRPVLPLGVTHAVTEDDAYNGYYIPKGAHVIPNAWAMAHDPLKYSRPEVFDPQRFFRSDGTLDDDEVLYTFGFGRRICPGRHMASATIWLCMATILTLFDIRRKLDDSGAEIWPEGKYCGGLVVHPAPFECTITPRSEETRRIILEALNHTTRSEPRSARPD